MHPFRQILIVWYHLICLTDTAINTGGAADYIGKKLTDSTWSCAKLITKDGEELIDEECVKDVSPPLEPLIPERIFRD